MIIGKKEIMQMNIAGVTSENLENNKDFDIKLPSNQLTESDLSSTNFIYVSEIEGKVEKALMEAEFNALAKSSTAEFEFFRRIPRNEWVKLKAHLEIAPIADQNAVQAFQLGEWNHPIFKQTDWALLAIKAYLNGDISLNRLSTLLLFDECQRSFPGQTSCFQIFESSGINMQAAELGSEAVQFILPLTEQQEILLNALAKKPQEETQFFVIPFDPNRLHLASLAYNDLGFKFGAIHLPNGEMQLAIFPPNLITEILKVRCGNNTMIPRPVLGFSEASDFESLTERDVFIPQKYITSPSSVHYTPCEPIEIYVHDGYYHITVESFNNERDIYLAISKRFKDKGLLSTWDRSLDRDHPSYYQNAEKQLIPFHNLIDSLIKLIGEIPFQDKEIAIQEIFAYLNTLPGFSIQSLVAFSETETFSSLALLSLPFIQKLIIDNSTLEHRNWLFLQALNTNDCELIIQLLEKGVNVTENITSTGLKMFLPNIFLSLSRPQQNQFLEQVRPSLEILLEYAIANKNEQLALQLLKAGAILKGVNLSVSHIFEWLLSSTSLKKKLIKQAETSFLEELLPHAILSGDETVIEQLMEMDIRPIKPNSVSLINLYSHFQKLSRRLQDKILEKIPQNLLEEFRYLS